MCTRADTMPWQAGRSRMRLTKRARNVLAVLLVGVAFWTTMAVALYVGGRLEPGCSGPQPSSKSVCFQDPSGDTRWITK